jgi:hypothetical protein
MRLGEHAKEFWASYLRLGKTQKIGFGLFLIGCGVAGLYADSLIAPVDDAKRPATNSTQADASRSPK